MNTGFSERNFYRFFCSTVLAIVGMDLYLFTHGWYLIALGGGKISIGVSWAIFFLPSLLMLPACTRLLREHSLRNVQLSFEIAKACMLWTALLWLATKPSVGAVYVLSACFGFLFSPFYPATYALLKNLFADNRVVKYSNLFEVSLQIAGATALLGSGFLFEQFSFLGIVFVSALAVTGSCFFLLRLEQVGVPEGKLNESWAKTYRSFFKLPPLKTLRTPEFLAGISHQIPQSAVLLLNIPLIVYVSQTIGAGPREYGYLDALYALSALATSLTWSKWPAPSTRTKPLVTASLLSFLGFVALACFPVSSVLPYLYIAALAAALTSAKLFGRATYIGKCSKEFVVTYTPLFQMVSNAVLILGAYFAGYIMDVFSVGTAMFCLAGMMLGFGVVFPLVQQKLQAGRHAE